MRSFVRSLPRAALTICLALPVFGSPPAPADEPDLDTLLRIARATLEADLAAWASYSFERRVVRERLDRDGEVSSRITYRFEVRPVAQGRLGLNRLTLRFETTPVEGAWLPRLFEVRSDVKLGIGRMEKRNRYEYTGYHQP